MAGVQRIDLAVNNTNLTDVVYQRLVDAMIRGYISPGERLLLEPLSEQLKVSLTPLRNALRRMEGEGLVETIPHRGTYVMGVTPDRLRDLFQVRLMYEIFAVAQIVSRVTDDQLSYLEELIDACDASLTNDVSEWIYAQKDQELHSYIVDLVENSVLSEHYSKLRVQQRVIVQTPQITSQRAQATSQEHLSILKALEARDFLEARRTVTEHIERAARAALRAAEADVH